MNLDDIESEAKRTSIGLQFRGEVLALIVIVRAADAMRLEIGMFDDREALRLAALYDDARIKLDAVK